MNTGLTQRTYVSRMVSTSTLPSLPLPFPMAFSFDILTPTATYAAYPAIRVTTRVTSRMANAISHRYVIYGTFFNSLEVTADRSCRPDPFQPALADDGHCTCVLFIYSLACVCLRVYVSRSFPRRPITHRYFTRSTKLTARKIGRYLLYTERKRESSVLVVALRSAPLWFRCVERRVMLILYLLYIQVEFVERVNWLRRARRRTLGIRGNFLTP